jgi:PAS domain S-box-containing protein
MTNQDRGAETVEARLAKLEAILTTAVAAIVTIDRFGSIDSINPATTKLFGYSADELLGQNVKILMPEPFAREHDGYISAYLRSGVKKIIGIGREVTGRRKDGSTFPIHLAVSEFEANGDRHFAGIITDLSERHAAEAALADSQDRLLQAQKLEAVGQLAGGIAHDFNNLLTVIVGNQELLEMRLSDEKDLALLRRAHEAAEKGGRLTERLLTFARRRQLQPTRLSLNDQISDMSELLRRSLGENIKLTTNLAPLIGSVRADPSEFENAILNLVINARDAMPNGGSIVIETDRYRVERDDSSSKLPVGDYVQISVSDTGSGMSPEILNRAFEPFFTTKAPGKGTGLGLSTILGFAQQSGGTVTVYSEVGHGTTVNIYLPCSKEDGTASSIAIPTDEIPRGAGESILLVEDRSDVRDIARQRLEELGYSVVEAENGQAAIDLLRSTRARPALVFSDVVMPGSNSGYDLAHWVESHSPEIKVLLTSGYPDVVARGQGEPLPNVRLLRKPYSRAELARAIRGALDRQ